MFQCHQKTQNVQLFEFSFNLRIFEDVVKCVHSSKRNSSWRLLKESYALNSKLKASQKLTENGFESSQRILMSIENALT